MTARLIFSALVVLILTSCKKEVTVPNGGIYRGEFREMTETDTLAEGVVFIALHEGSQVFDMRGDSLTNAPATHMGTYVVDGATTMKFTNADNYNSNYDIDHYLDTTYNYTFDNVNFTLTQTWEGKTYQFLMKRH